MVRRPSEALCMHTTGTLTAYGTAYVFWSYLYTHRKETQSAVVWSCLLFIRSVQTHLARHSEREKKTRQAEEEVGRQHQGMDRPGVRQVPEGSGEQGKSGENWLQNHLWYPNDPRG